MMVVLRPALPEPIQPFSSTATLPMPNSLARNHAAAADDHHVVAIIGRRVSPGWLPVLMAGKGGAGEREDRVLHKIIPRPLAPRRTLPYASNSSGSML